MTTTTETAVASWMLDQVDRDGWLDQWYAATSIKEKFGDKFVYANESGNPAISAAVLGAFRKLTSDTVVWCRASKRWEKRNSYHGPGRLQDC